MRAVFAMAEVDYHSISIHYEAYGTVFDRPLDLAGGNGPAIQISEGFTLNALALHADSLRLIAMDQRNAGRLVGALEENVGSALIKLTPRPVAELRRAD
jgi:hypothetical protein